MSADFSLPAIAKLHEILVELGELLEWSVNLENSSKGSWRNAIPIPFIFKRIPFDKITYESTKIEDEISRLLKQIQFFIDYPTKEEFIFHKVRDYLSKFKEQQNLFSYINARLYKKIDEPRLLSIREYNYLMKNYEKLANERRKHGDNLNKIMHQLEILKEKGWI